MLCTTRALLRPERLLRVFGALHDCSDFWQGPETHFLVAGTMLKEAVDDLKWADRDVRVRVDGRPPGLVLSTVGPSANSVSVTIPEVTTRQE